MRSGRGGPASVGRAVGLGPGVQDRVVGELDPVDHVGRVEDQRVDGLVGELVEGERAEGDHLEVVGPGGRRVVRVLGSGRQLGDQLEGDGTASQTLVQPA